MIDAWSGPTPTPQQFPANEPDGIRKLLGLIKSVQQELRDVRSHLPGAGGISNDALTSPVVPGIVSSLANNFALSFTQVDLIDASLVVPAGCTRLQVNATGRMTVVNSYGFDNSVDIYVHLGTTYGEIFTMSVPTLATVTVAASFADLASGLTPGSTIHLYARAGSLNSISADTSNMAVLTATLLWLR